LVKQFKDTPYDDLPEEYAGLTSEDLFNILLCFRGRERKKYPPIFALSYIADGRPKFAFIFPD